jgi:hypothetical protein
MRDLAINLTHLVFYYKFDDREQSANYRPFYSLVALHHQHCMAQNDASCCATLDTCSGIGTGSICSIVSNCSDIECYNNGMCAVSSSVILVCNLHKSYPEVIYYLGMLCFNHRKGGGGCGDVRKCF